MINRLRRALAGLAPPTPPGQPHDPAVLAVATLLAEAAHADGGYGRAEAERVAALLRRRFGLTGPELDAVFDAADQAARDNVELYRVTRAVRDTLSPDDCEAVVEMLWEVALADGEIDAYEESLIRRAVGLLHVSDRASGAARKRVLSRAAQ